MLGYAESELLTMSCDQFARAEDASDELALFRELQSGARENYHIEKPYLRKDGTTIWGRLHVCRLKLPGEEPSVVLAMVEDVTKGKQAEQKLKDSQSALHELTARLIQAQEEERHRLARELHDDIGQRLSVLMIEMERLSQEMPVMARAQVEGFGNILQQIDELTADVHQLSHQLHSTKLHYIGLKAALKELCHQVVTQYGIGVVYELEDVPDLPTDVQLCLYRVAQEALSNVAKHSHASKASVRLITIDGIVRLEIKDTGIGFGATTQASGLGLASMRERLRIVGGELVVSSNPGEGTQVIAIVPNSNSDQVMEAA